MTPTIHSVDDDDAKLIDSESAASRGRVGIGRGRGVNHFAALSRALGGCLTTLSHVHDRGPSGSPEISVEEKDGLGRRERRKRVVGAFCGFGNVGNGTTKGFAPCLTTFRFSFHGLYTSGALVKPSRPVADPSRAVVPISLYLPSRPVVHGGIRCFHSLPLSLSRSG